MQDLKAFLGSWYRPTDRFEAADSSKQAFNPFDVPTELIQDMISRQVRPWIVTSLDLSVAGEIQLQTPGFHVVLFGYSAGATKPVNTTAFIEVFNGKYKLGDKGFPMKHNRGVSGPFAELTLKWPAQNGVFADVIIYCGMFPQWVNGEAAT